MKSVKDVIIGISLILIVLFGIVIPISEEGLEILEKLQSKDCSESNFIDMIQQTKKGVVHIQCPRWQGSGFVIGQHLIVTARHVVEGVENFEITFDCGGKTTATRAISSKNYDIAFIWFDDVLPEKMILELGSIKDCKLGQSVYVVGSPHGKINFNSVSLGIISGLNRDWDMVDPYTGEKYGWEIAFTSDSAAHPGNSGCPVFTMDGIVRGILVGGYSPVLNCSMPCDLFLFDIEEIELMFVMDKYQFEKEPEYSDSYYAS